MLFDKTSYGNKGLFKYYAAYMHKTEAFQSPLCIKRPQLIGHSKHFNDNNTHIYIFFLINDKELLKKYSEIWDKIKSLSKKKNLIKSLSIIINILV